MNSEILPFQLGIEYENWEFDLEPIEDRIRGYDSYIYIRTVSVFGVKTRNIELIFHWDILVAVILEFEESDLPKVKRLSLFNYIQINQYFYLSDSKISSLIHHSLLS